MQMWTEIRRRVLVEGASKRSIRRDYGVGWQTLQKILQNTEPAGYRQSTARAKTKLGPYLPVIEEILASDREAPPGSIAGHRLGVLLPRGGETSLREGGLADLRHAELGALKQAGTRGISPPCRVEGETVCTTG